ncbi:hypothetical protein [Winogradskyella rapida]|uniref:Uncharacterized protein n=1 Tax=Winogradskyella rapida TaxID=549701 RepID=A0ABW3KT13_9FLAO
MAVLIEAFNVVVNDEAFITKPEKRKLFLETITTNAFCSDGLIYRIGFMDSQNAYQYISFLENEVGLTYQDKLGFAQDIILVNMLTGPTTKCNWFEFERKKHFINFKEFTKSNENFSIGWKKYFFAGNPDNYLVFRQNNNQENSFFNFEGLCVPFGWTPDTAIYESNYIQNPEDELEKITEENGVATFIHNKTGEKIYVGSPPNSTFDILKKSEEFQNSIGGKIIRDEFGRCKLFGYRGNGLFNGELFSLEELTKFAINIIGNEYLETNTYLSDLNYHINNNPNFIIKSHKNIAVYVRVDNSDEIDFEKLKRVAKCYTNNNYYSRLAVITFWEFNKGGWKKVKIGENGSKDGVNPYIVNLKFKSLDVENTNRVYDKNLTHNDLLLLFKKAWKSRDASIIEPYIDENFNYFSDWVFDTLSSREEYIEYFSGKLRTLKNNKIQVEYDLVTDNNSNQYAMLFNQKGEKAIFTIRAEKGKIISAKMAKLETHSEITDNNNVNFVPHTLQTQDKKTEEPTRNKVLWWKRLLKIK